MHPVEGFLLFCAFCGVNGLTLKSENGIESTIATSIFSKHYGPQQISLSSACACTSDSEDVSGRVVFVTRERTDTYDIGSLPGLVKEFEDRNALAVVMSLVAAQPRRTGVYGFPFWESPPMEIGIPWLQVLL